jgi:arsenate reductase-like glutaredoxin family protein
MNSFILGRTGNFRAPAVKKGRTLMIGFNEEMYREILK